MIYVGLMAAKSSFLANLINKNVALINKSNLGILEVIFNFVFYQLQTKLHSFDCDWWTKYNFHFPWCIQSKVKSYILVKIRCKSSLKKEYLRS